MNKQDLGNQRKDYCKDSVDERNLAQNPYPQFEKWFQEATVADGVDEANAMSISTLGLDGFPKTRIVLLKEYSEEGFVFYTNYESEKGKALAVNNKVCISFFWAALEKQIIIKGIVEKVSSAMSDAYFKSRPRGSQLGALASAQSDVIASKITLEEKLLLLEKEFEGREIPRPAHWGGYILKPLEFEFWQGRPSRLHDRFRYKKVDTNNWLIDRLSP